jgi:hypothetical protein
MQTANLYSEASICVEAGAALCLGPHCHTGDAELLAHYLTCSDETASLRAQLVAAQEALVAEQVRC